MLILSNRLRKIADFIKNGETVADIGTDHAKLPIFLRLEKKSPNVILSDLRTGPLSKAMQNIHRFAQNQSFDIRIGSGLETIEAGETDIIVIAGMGGLLTADILSADMEKTCSFKKFILQPRNAEDKLREWLLANGFKIIDEALVKEGKFICQIIVTSPIGEDEENNRREISRSELQYEISPRLFDKSDPLLTEFIERKIMIEEKVLLEIEKAEKTQRLSEAAQLRRLYINRRIKIMKELLQKAAELHSKN